VAEKRVIDWESIKLDYEVGVKTLRKIAEENGISHTLINKKAKELDWSRDLSAKIRAKADAIVTKSEVSKLVTKESLVTEREIIEVNANINTNIT